MYLCDDSLVFGNVKGKFELLFEKVFGFQEKHGPFAAVFCVGTFFEANLSLEENKERLNACSHKKEMSIPLYFITNEEKQAVDLERDQMLCKNVFFLGKEGMTVVANMNVCFVSGSKLNASFDSKMWNLPLNGVELLLTNFLPDEFDWLKQIAVTSAPRYHFSVSENMLEPLLPYINDHVIPRHVTRRIVLESLEESNKKSFYACTVAPIDSLSEKDIPPQFVPNPYINLSEHPLEVKQTDIPNHDEPVHKKTKFAVPADYICHLCNIPGHLKRDCPSSQSKSAPVGISRSDCWFCLSSPNTETHLIASIGTDAYVACPKGPFCLGHVLIVPIEHIGIVDLRNVAVRSEISVWKQALKSWAQSRGDIMTFYERVLPSKAAQQHFIVHCIPVPRKYSDSLESTVISAAAGFGVTLKHVSQEQAAIICNDYYVCMEINDKIFASSVDQRNKFVPKLMQFSREMIAFVTNAGHKGNWKNCIVDKTNEELSTEEFKNSFSQFDPFRE